VGCIIVLVVTGIIGAGAFFAIPGLE